MIARIIPAGHAVYELPALLEWDVRRTGAVPCDSFALTCLYTPDMAGPLHLAVSLLLLDGPRLALHGIVDEYEIRLTERGRTVSVSGRGYAARLLDNEARPVTYQAVTLRELVRAHAEPYGLTCAACADLRASGYTVPAGRSQWRVLADFCRTYGGFTPYLSAAGELTAARRAGASRSVESGVLSVVKRENHYGVLSEALVVDKSRGVSYAVENADFLRRGGRCRRVICTPGQSTWAAMRYTGEYQIARSREDETTLRVTLAGTQEAEPGDAVTLKLPEQGLSGTYCLRETAYRCGSGGETTELTLRKES